MNASHDAHKDSTSLAFDCSVTGVSVALVHHRHVYVRRDHSANTQAAQLMPMIEAVLGEARIDYTQIDRLITTYGPGSFTGIRIGLAAAQGILAVVPMEVVAITSLAAIAANACLHVKGEAFWVTINAGKGELYAQLFHVKHNLPCVAGDILVCTPEIFEARHDGERIAGNAKTLLPGIKDASWITQSQLPDAETFVYTIAPPTSPELLVPLYIRAPDAKLPAVALPLE